MRFRPVLVTLLFAAGTLGAYGADDAKKDELPPVDLNANKLSEAEVRGGWKLLFDGKALIGLRSLKSTDPLKSGWKIDRNSLVLPKDIKNDGKVTGGDLVATVLYDDYEFRFDFLLAASADTGILYFARSAMGQKPTGHEFQIIDDVHHPDGLKGGDLKRTGALYGILPRTEGAFIRMAERYNEEHWNHGRLVVQGRHVEHWLNDQKCLEYDLGPDLLKKATAAKVRVPAGFGNKIKSPIVLLDQGTQVSFRNLKIRPLTSPAAATPPVVPARTNPIPGQPPARVAPTPVPTRPLVPR
jgi:3-keto-disaccharide hydrolase